jgi:hypothetical protein
MDIKCINCFDVINPLRIKALPHTRTCVECSTTGAKRALPMQFGEKDDTWNEVVFMEPEEFDHYENNKKLKVKLDVADEEEEEDEIDEDEEDEETI